MEQVNRILIVEDDKEILEGIRIYLKNQGYVVFGAYNGVEGLEVLGRETIHLAIVDVMMPQMDGITMTMRLRERYDFPVIMLTAKSEEIDKITGLNIGADDYVTKPFAPMELLARVNSQLRRYAKYLAALEAGASDRAGDGRTGGNASLQKDNLQNADLDEPERIYTVGGLELNETTVSVTVDGEPVKLTPLEFKLLALMMKHPGRVFSAEELYERVWNEKAVTTDTIMVHVRKIREKIEINPKNPRYLKVVWGVGYKIEK